jgi:endoglucanase
MIEITPFLKQLLSLPGLSSYEEPVREVIAETWKPLVDELNTSKLGSLHGLRRASTPGKHPSILVATHMDAIGLMVTSVEGGWIRVMQIGGLDMRILPGQWVTVHGQRDLPGILQFIPDRLQKSSRAGSPPQINDLLVDVGLSERDVTRLVKLGDLVSFAQAPFEMEGGFVVGHSLDNRASVAALTVCLDELRRVALDWDVWAVATVQEEVGLMGAQTSSFELMPDLAVALDVTFAKSPASSDYRTFPLGKGPTLGIGANVHPALTEAFKAVADEMDMPYAIETMAKGSGTDGMGMQTTATGIPVMVIGIPLRYMHTPLEMVAVKDIQRAGRLLARFIMQLNPNSMEKLFAEQKA